MKPPRPIFIPIFISLAIVTLMVGYKVKAFPLYFFCDEAIHGVEAQQILTTGHDLAGVTLPLFVRGLGDFQLGLSVYAQVPFNAIFGMTETAIRFRSIFFFIFALGMVSYSSAVVWKLRSPWMIPFIFSAAPMWWLHSRAGFEPMQAVSLLAGGLSMYLLWTDRLANGQKQNITIPIVTALLFALALYSYVPARGWVLLIVGGLLVVNCVFHWKHFRHTAVFLLAFGIFFSPMVWNQISHADQALQRLRSVGLDQFLNLPFQQQYTIVIGNYFHAIDPRFWFTWEGTNNSGPELRHVIANHAPIPTWYVLPILMAIVLCLKDKISLRWRVLLVPLFVAALPSSPFAITSLRTFPIALSYVWLAALGLGYVFDLLFSKMRLIGTAVAWCMALLPLSLTLNTLETAPYAYADYGFYGLQIGSEDIFTWAAKKPRDTHFVLTSDLFNAAEIFAEFYWPKGQFQYSVIGATETCLPKNLDQNAIYIVRSETLDELQRRQCPVEFHEEWNYADPKGKKLFAAGTLSYSTAVTQWLEQEKIRKKTLVAAEGKYLDCDIQHTLIDGGSIQPVFDGNDDTLVRTAQINPFVITMNCPYAISAARIVISHNRDIQATLSGVASNGSQWVRELDLDKNLEMQSGDINAPDNAVASKLTFTFKAKSRQEDDFVHLNDIRLVRK